MDLKAPVNKIIPFSSVDGFETVLQSFFRAAIRTVSTATIRRPSICAKLRGMCKHMSRRRAYDGKRKGLL